MPSYTSSEPQTRPECVPPGEYVVEILNAEETISKQGNDMIELKLRVLPHGSLCFDGLVFIPAAYWKIDSFRASTGEKVLPNQEVDVQCDDLIGRRARVRLIVESFNGKDRNKVASWLPPKPSKPAATTSAMKGGESDDNIPF